MKRVFFTIWLVPLLVTMAWVTLAQAVSVLQAPPASISTGGKLYDKWWAEAPGATEPKGDQPLWATQTTNTRKGTDTWRCKECHGWDYGGKDGAYGSGSHKTGFVGVSVAASKKSQAELVGILKGSSNSRHDFSQVMDADSINNLASFLKEGLVDMSQYIDYATKKPKSANASHGKVVYEGTCAACHGADGTNLNFGSETVPEYVGTLAKDNPWEFVHKVRAGQPGAAMPSAIVNGWTMEDVVDALAHAQTLPTEKPKASSGANVAAGGKLYDKWWTQAPGATEPKGDHPLWATQTTNTRKGTDTWRCKECHGWDYKGKDGAYGSGSHKTGFVGVFDAASKKSVAELVAILKGSSNPNHDFSKLMDADSVNNLASFLKEGLVDDAQFIDYATKKPKNANVARGKDLFGGTCAACHGSDGTTMNFGSETEPEFVGTIAVDNPWEFLHKVRSGQPGVAIMPSAIVSGWPTQDAVDVLAHAQSLPTEKPKVLPKTGGPVDLMVLAVLAAIVLMGAGVLVRISARR